LGIYSFEKERKNIYKKMYSSKETTLLRQDDQKTLSNKSMNLKIVIENNTSNDESIEIDDENATNNNDNNKKDEISDVSDEEGGEVEEECGLEVDIPESEIECTFSVNLDKMPPTLQNTILVNKLL